jgi:hypothetical protein
MGNALVALFTATPWRASTLAATARSKAGTAGPWVRKNLQHSGDFGFPDRLAAVGRKGFGALLMPAQRRNPHAHG